MKQIVGDLGVQWNGICNILENIVNNAIYESFLW